MRTINLKLNGGEYFALLNAIAYELKATTPRTYGYKADLKRLLKKVEESQEVSQ